MIDLMRRGLTRLGVLAGHPLAFLIGFAYVAAIDVRSALPLDGAATTAGAPAIFLRWRSFSVLAAATTSAACQRRPVLSFRPPRC